jgi:hypothetical protein
MTKTLTSRTLAVVALGLGGSIAAALATSSVPVHGAADTKGLWTAEPSRWKTKSGSAVVLQLSLRRSAGKGRGDHHQSFPVALEELRGLDRTKLEAASAEASFALARDAGTLAFEGRFRAGEGAGHYTFSPSQEYLVAMARLGYGDLDAERVYSLAVHDVSRAFIRELDGLGYGRLAMDQLVSMRIHGAGPEFIRELKKLGYENLSVDQLVSMRIHGAGPEFIRELKQLGYERAAVNDLVSLRIHGVTPEFIRKVQGRGRTDVSLDRLVQMKIHGRGFGEH